MPETESPILTEFCQTAPDVNVLCLISKVPPILTSRSVVGVQVKVAVIPSALRFKFVTSDGSAVSPYILCVKEEYSEATFAVLTALTLNS